MKALKEMKKKKKSAGDNKRGALMEDANGITVEKSEKKKRKSEVQSNNNESYAVPQDTANDVNSTATEMLERKRKHEKKARTITDDCTKGKMEKVKRKKKKGEDDQGSVDVATGLTCAEVIADFIVNETQASGVGNDTISRKQVKDSSKDPKRKNSKKEVRFSNELKVFPESIVPESGKGQNKVAELIQGKRFSKIEDEIVKETVLKYIDVHNLARKV